MGGPQADLSYGGDADDISSAVQGATVYTAGAGLTVCAARRGSLAVRLD
jgi:hypothetical protein